CPATGFSFDLERIMAALEAERSLPAVSGPDVLLIDFSPDKRAAHRLARVLRERGCSVARDIIKRELAGSLAYARETAIRSVVVLGMADLPSGTVLVHDVRTETRRTVPLEAFERALARGEAPWIV
ncbi:MAG: ATP phosphoribosyltransferase regulatory subunit, partial [Zetaproteobacteria bacterium]